MTIQHGYDFLNAIELEFSRLASSKQYELQAADNRAKELMSIKFLLMDFSELLTAVTIARHMHTSGHTAEQCLALIVATLERRGYV